jgi:hypothetical protein
MSRKLFVAGLFALACSITLYATARAADEAPAPRPVAESDKKPEGKGRFGGFDKSKLDPEKLKEFKDKFGGGKGGFDKSKIDPEKLKDLKEKFGGKGGFGKGKKGEE